MKKILINKDIKGLTRGFSYEVKKETKEVDFDGEKIEQPYQKIVIYGNNIEHELWQDHTDRTETEIKNRIAELLGCGWIEEDDSPNIDLIHAEKYETLESAFDAKRSELGITAIEHLIEVNRDNLPADLVALFDGLKAQKAQSLNKLDELKIANDVEGLKKFHVRPEDTRFFTEKLKKVRRKK